MNGGFPGQLAESLADPTGQASSEVADLLLKIAGGSSKEFAKFHASVNPFEQLALAAQSSGSEVNPVDLTRALGKVRALIGAAGVTEAAPWIGAASAASMPEMAAAIPAAASTAAIPAAIEGAGAAATGGGIMSAITGALPWIGRALAFPVNHPFISMGAAMLLSMLASHSGGNKQPADGMMPAQAPQQPDSEGLAQLLAAASGQRGNTIADLKRAYLMQQLMQLQGRAMENETRGQGMKSSDAIAYLP